MGADSAVAGQVDAHDLADGDEQAERDGDAPLGRAHGVVDRAARSRRW